MQERTEQVDQRIPESRVDKSVKRGLAGGAEAAKVIEESRSREITSEGS